MTTAVPPGKRLWTCPDCGTSVQLSITQLDPLACDACLSKLKGSVSTKAGAANSSGSANSSPSAGGPLQVWGALPESTKLVAALAVGMLAGLLIGFVAGRFTAPQSSATHQAPSGTGTPSQVTNESDDDSPDESTRPGPDYKWIKPYVRKDGVRVRGHWAKDTSKRKS